MAKSFPPEIERFIVKKISECIYKKNIYDPNTGVFTDRFLIAVDIAKKKREGESHVTNTTAATTNTDDES